MSGDSAENLYTQSQKDFVAKISDIKLRDQLLHTVRLSDLLRDDRDRALKSLYAAEGTIMELRRGMQPPAPPAPPPVRILCEDVKPSRLWRIWAKALGPKSGCTDSEANMVAIIRTGFVLLTIFAEICIIYNVIFIQLGS